MASQEQLLTSLVQGEDGRIWAGSRTGWSVTEQPPVPVCSWTGVTCENGSTVTGIDIEESDFLGTIPEALGQLTTLKSINLKQNIVHGTIPRAVANLPNLQTIDVSENHINGPLPVFASAGLLKVIASDNSLTGSIPQNFGDGHDQLLDIDIIRNQLTGTIPESIGRIANLNKLSLSENHFYGSIPENIGYLQSLQFIYLDLNKFVGTIPRSLTPMDSPLKEVWLQGNLLSGTVPAAFAEMKNLINLYVDGNKLTGQLPQDLCKPEINADFFEGVELSQREYCSSIACPVGTVSLEGVFPCNPCDSGTFSPYLGREGTCINRDPKQVLKSFWLKTNGSQWTGNNNWFFDGVDHCDFTGVTCNEEKAVISIVLKNMGLRGPIIEDVGFLEHLQKLDLSDNQLYGYIPSDLRFAPLDELDLSGNQLVGIVPPMLCLLGNVNGNGAGGQYDCDKIVCPGGTYSPTGRAGGGNTCQSCNDGSEFAGRKSCGGSYGYSTASSGDDGMSMTGVSLLVVALFAVVILFAVLGFMYYNRRKGTRTKDVSDVVDFSVSDHIDVEGKKMPPPSDPLYMGTFPDSVEIQEMDDDDYSSVTRVRKKKAKKRAMKKKKYDQVRVDEEDESASSSQKGLKRRGGSKKSLQYDEVGAEDNEDQESVSSNPVWLDVPKLESSEETPSVPNIT